jgi:hypothetical protein
MLCEKTTKYGKECMATAIQGSKNCFFHASDEEVANHQRIKQEKLAEKKARQAQREAESLIRQEARKLRSAENEKLRLQREAEKKARPRNFTLKKLLVRHWVGLILLEKGKPMEQPEVYDAYGNMMGKHTTSHAIYLALQGPQFKEEIVGRRFVFTISDEKFKKEMEELREWVKRTDKTPNFSIRKYFGWSVSGETPAVSTSVASEPTSVSDVTLAVEKMNLDSGESSSSNERSAPAARCTGCWCVPFGNLTRCCVCEKMYCDRCSLDGKCKTCFSPVNGVKEGDRVAWFNDEKFLIAVVRHVDPYGPIVEICTETFFHGEAIFRVNVRDLYEIVHKPLSDTCYGCKTIPDYNLTPCCVCKEVFCEECSFDGKCIMCYTPVKEVNVGDHVVWINSQKALHAVVLKTIPHSFDVSICTQVSGGGGTIHQVSVNDLYERVSPLPVATSTPPSEGEEWILGPEATVERISSDSNSHANLPEADDSAECENCSASKNNCVEEYRSHLKHSKCNTCGGVYCNMCILDGVCIMCCVDVDSVSEGDRLIYIDDGPDMIYVTVVNVDTESDSVLVRCDGTSIHHKEGETIKARLRNLYEKS